MRFNPYGLGSQLSPEDAAHFQTASIAQAVLTSDVPEDVRKNFERARKLHQYGVLEYEFFTAAADYALLVLEGALRLRFLSYYDYQIPVLHANVAETLKVRTFDDVREARRKYKLRKSAGRTHQVPVGALALLDWARREQLLQGTRTRIVDQALATLRDHAAHPVTYTLQMPPHSSGTINDVAEVINKLWGHDTPGGRLFPSPVAREPRVVGLAPDRSASVEMRPDQVHTVEEEQRNWLYAVFLAVEGEQLVSFEPRGLCFSLKPGFQTTAFPCQQLWQGTWDGLTAAVDAGEFTSSGDTVQHLERLFFIRAAGEEIDHARSPADLVALSVVPEGRWYAVRADSPLEARAHVRGHEPQADDTCPECFAHVEGRFDSAADALALTRNSSDRSDLP